MNSIFVSMKHCALLFLLLPLTTLSQKTKLIIADTQTGASFRSLSVVNDSVVWAGGSNGTICLSTNGAKTFQCTAVVDYDSTEFRSVYAFNDTTALVCNIGSPARILRTTDGGQNWEIVYENTHAEAFIDGIDFWNENEGICYGDPVNGKLLVLRTGDGGITWREMIGLSSPLLVDGEASFAASGTSVRCFDTSRVVIATGGALSRLLVSNDRGLTWQTVVTPIIQGSASTGIFSFDFKNELEGVIVGGDFKNDTLTNDHIFYTTDGGKTWSRPFNPTRGYRECVEYLDSGYLVAVGPAGIDVSYSHAINWEKLSDEKKFHVVRQSRNGKLVVIAGGDGRIGTVEIVK
jgi:photosystem II stability/assembly factor-like uncharacterized protein